MMIIGIMILITTYMTGYCVGFSQKQCQEKDRNKLLWVVRVAIILNIGFITCYLMF